MLRRVALVRTDVSDELRASILRVTRIGKLRTTIRLVTANVFLSSTILVTLMMEVLSSSETSVLTRGTLRNISEDANLHSHRRENLKSYANDKTTKHLRELRSTLNTPKSSRRVGPSATVD
jgi:hypothetical protein